MQGLKLGNVPGSTTVCEATIIERSWVESKISYNNKSVYLNNNIVFWS